jgi:hyperosmotically inducible periplasmic protein
MKNKSTVPAHLTRTAFAAAMALMLSGPIHAEDVKAPADQYESAVTYDVHHGEQSTYTLRASDLIGRDLHDAQANKIGTIDDLIVSRDGDAVMAVVSFGGFLNVGAKQVTIPHQDLRVSENGKQIFYNTSKEELKGLSPFTFAKDNRADTTQKRADNSAHNNKERAGDTLTPFDQSNAKGDVAITRAIRKALGDDDTLGTNAQNVKVITVDGRVTLRGAVASADQQARIVAIAGQAVGPAHVQSELEVIKR